MLLGPGEIRMKRRFSLQKYAHSRANHEIEAGGDNEEETCRMHNVWFLEETVRNFRCHTADYFSFSQIFGVTPLTRIGYLLYTVLFKVQFFIDFITKPLKGKTYKMKIFKTCFLDRSVSLL